MKTAWKKNPWSWVPSLYFIEGVPYAIVVMVAEIMYSRFGMGNAEIAFYTSLFYIPWVIKPFWSPFVDIFKTKRWWIDTMQLLIGAALGGIAFTIPGSFWLQASLCLFWLIAFSSATHDIAADGFYMHGLDDNQQSFFVGIRSTFYRLAMMFGQGALIVLAGTLEVFTRDIHYAWALTFYLAAGLLIVLGLYHQWALPRPKSDHTIHYEGQEMMIEKKMQAKQIVNDFIDIVRSFFKKDGIVFALMFILLYRVPEGMLVKMCPLFLVDPVDKGGLGLSPQDIGFVLGTIGVVGLTIGGILGGLYSSIRGLKKSLWLMVCAITLPDIVYVILAYLQPSSLLLINVCIFFEQFGYGFGFTAYMLYLIYFSQGEQKTSHYAICTGLMALGLLVPGMIAGWLQELVGYNTFFIIVMFLCIITFVVSALVKINPTFGKQDKSTN
ncbi:MAG: MFS transporter [Prevotella sp.]|nr:MFS transporter [Candidatus Equicola stercoris]